MELWRLVHQQVDPLAFIEAQRSESVQVTLLLWLVQLAIGGIGIALLGLIGEPDIWPWIFFHASLALFLMQLVIGLAIMFVGHARFWLTYLFSPPLPLIIFLCALTPATSLGWLGWLVVPAVMGHTIAVAGVVRVKKCADERARYSVPQRGLHADMPHLQWWNRVRLLRLAIAGVTAIGGGLLLWFMPPPSRVPLAWLGLVIGVASTLSLGATVLCWLGYEPILVHDKARKQWRTTISGRFALFAPPQQLYQLLTTEEHSTSIVLTVLSTSCLGPSLQRAVAMLPPHQAHDLLLTASLQAGGATAIGYLQPRLSLPLQLVAKRYADLASEASLPSEAAKFVDRQHWRRLLPSNQPSNARTRGTDDSFATPTEQEITQLLAEVHHALCSYQHSPQVDLAHANLAHFVDSLDLSSKSSDSPAAPASWPIALLNHLDSHRTLLLSA